ncbi:hypothetical protein BDB01DRAFT_847312 [Pilobolus umbonatus]|nr:hypothetical protein BDB01DRAFT_847312 [Pilobolus umbonatus]
MQPIKEEFYYPSKEECHTKTEEAYDNWSDSLKTLLKITDSKEDTHKTAKMFVQADSLYRSTRTSMEKTKKVLEQLVDKRNDILSIMEIFKDIQMINTGAEYHK